MLFAERLKEVRTKRKLTQRKLAALVSERIEGSIKRNTISNYENEKSAPDLENLLAIAYALNCSIDYLLGFESELPDVIR